MGFRHSIVVSVVFVSAVLALTVAVPQLAGPSVWSAVGAVYVLTAVLGGGLWYRRTEPLRFRETVWIAAVVVIALVPITPRLFVEWGDSSPSLLRYWSEALSVHLRWFVPMAFTLPLGAATTRRQQLGTVAVMLLPSIQTLFDGFVLHPERFDPLWTTPITLLVSTGFWVLVLVALASPLSVFGRQLTDRDGSRRHPGKTVPT